MSTTSEHTSTKLFSLIATGDTRAFHQLYEMHRDQLFLSAIKLTKSTTMAEEVVQDVFINLWVSREQLANVQNADAYIFRVLFNAIRSFFRKETNHEKLIQRAALLQKEFTDDDAASGLNVKDIQLHLTRLVEQLPPQRRTIYKLSKYDGLKIDEIATQLNISPNTVKATLAKAVDTLRTQMKDIGFVTALLAIFEQQKYF